MVLYTRCQISGSLVQVADLRKSLFEKREYCGQNVGGEILDQEGSRQGGSGAM